jgi:hypothetical protein
MKSIKAGEVVLGTSSAVFFTALEEGRAENETLG